MAARIRADTVAGGLEKGFLFGIDCRGPIIHTLRLPAIAMRAGKNTVPGRTPPGNFLAVLLPGAVRLAARGAIEGFVATVDNRKQGIITAWS